MIELVSANDINAEVAKRYSEFLRKYQDNLISEYTGLYTDGDPRLTADEVVFDASILEWIFQHMSRLWLYVNLNEFDHAQFIGPTFTVITWITDMYNPPGGDQITDIGDQIDIYSNDLPELEFMINYPTFKSVCCGAHQLNPAIDEWLQSLYQRKI